ncbi:hypothetical protein TgHK011_009025 [Trichoderma gracile]|nr:hypothetical protein TgHK011_009025 [Trichoderma gracile]
MDSVMELGAAALPNNPPPAIWRSTADDDSTLLDDLDHEPTVLKSYRDWDEWKRDIQPHVDVFVWRYMWSEDELRARPVPPQVQQFNRHARDVSELTKDEFDLYHDQNKAYYARKQEYDRQNDMVDRAKALVLRTVAPAKAELLDDGRTLREWVALLRDTTAPTYRQRIEIERGNYNAVLERFDLDGGSGGNGSGGNGNGGGGETDWAHEWYSAVTRCHKLNFPETLCGTWLRDLADCILPFSPPLFDKFMLGADRLDLAAIEWRAEAEEAMAFKKTHKCSGGGDDSDNSFNNGSGRGRNRQQETPRESHTNEATPSSARPPLQAVPSEEKEVVELDAASPNDGDRLWTFLEVYREIRDLEFGGSEADVAMSDGGGGEDDDDDDDNADAASGKGSDSPQCPACNLRGHELRHCWYAFEERRPRGVMLSRARMRRVERAIRTDKNLEQRVDDIYTAFTGGRFYQRQLMLGSTQSAW